MSGDIDLSLVIPVFDEEESVALLAAEIGSVLGAGPWSWEVLWVDDGSRDRSREVLQRLAEEEPRFRVLALARNCGQSAALAAGLRNVRGEVVVTLDADLQNDPADIPRLLDELEGCDMVSGVRAQRRDSWVRRVSSRVANGARRWVTGDPATDVGCSLKAYRAPVLRHLPLFNGAHRFLPALVQRNGGRIREIPVNHRPRRHGEAKYNIRNRLWRGLVDLAGVRWLLSRWIDPFVVSELSIEPRRREGRPDE